MGYDANNYYYIDTCARGKWGGIAHGCRTGPWDYEAGSYAHRDATTGRLHVWRVNKFWLAQMMNEWKGGGSYLRYSGPPGHLPY